MGGNRERKKKKVCHWSNNGRFGERRTKDQRRVLYYKVVLGKRRNGGGPKKNKQQNLRPLSIKQWKKNPESQEKQARFSKWAKEGGHKMMPDIEGTERSSPQGTTGEVGGRVLKGTKKEGREKKERRTHDIIVRPNP